MSLTCFRLPHQFASDFVRNRETGIGRLPSLSFETVPVRWLLAGVLLSALLVSCNPQPTRPQNVPADATYVPGTNLGGWWDQCIQTLPGQTTHCRIWNAAGLLLEDDDFVPYDGGAPPTSEELKIAPDPTYPQLIRLKNKRLLLPKSRFDEMKSFLEGLGAKN